VSASAQDADVAAAWSCRLGTVGYEEAGALQRALAAARGRGEIPDVLLLLEHWPVFTKGRRTDPGELGMGEDWYRMQGIEVCETDRGGRVTYHGPGQLVGYPIVDLGNYADDVQEHVRRLERVMIEALGAHGVEAQVFDGLTGVWTAGRPPIAEGDLGPQGTPVGGRGGGSTGEARKIGSIGVHVSRGITTHGFAINVNNDLQPFEWVVPCGIENVRMSSLSRELGSEQDMAAFVATAERCFEGAFGRRLETVDPARIRDAAGVVTPTERV
jgi:lipoyl(octanoyl) transferase